MIKVDYDFFFVEFKGLIEILFKVDYMVFDMEEIKVKGRVKVRI